MAPVAHTEPYLSPVDFDLHGLVGIRLVNATRRDAAAVARQLGPIQRPLAGEPDITIRFVDRLPDASTVRYLGVDEAGFTRDAFLVLRSKHKARARVQIPFEQIGGRCEIVVEAGLPAVPLLVPIINLTALARGVLPLHASAFSVDGRGVLATGWSKGGKTEALLAFMERGARYIGDEWVYITGDGQHIYGIPEPIRIWDWYLRQMPRYRARVARGERARLTAIRLAVALERRMPDPAPGRMLGRAVRLLERQLFADVHPQRLFGPDALAPGGPLDRVFFMASHARPDVIIEPIDPAEIAQRMMFSLQYERLPFMSYYYMYRFAFPAARNTLIEEAEERQRALLARVLVDTQACAVYHPYPAVIADLYAAMHPYIASA